MISIIVDARADPPVPNSRQFLSSFYKIHVYDPVQNVSDLFFSQSGDLPPVQLIDQKGSWIVLNLWATWCAPCVAELPSLNRLARQTEDGIAVMAVSVDRQLDARRISYHMRRWRLESLTPLHDTASILPGRLDVKHLPVTYLIDKDGFLRAAFYGRAKWESEEAAVFLAALQQDPDFLTPYMKK